VGGQLALSDALMLVQHGGIALAEAVEQPRGAFDVP
jgi:hypothetical protein